MKKVLAVVLALCMIFSFAACGKKDEGSKEKDSWTVGICQLVQHPALDKATQGFIDAVKAELGDKVEFIEQNGSGEPAN